MSEWIIDIDKYRKDYGFAHDCDDCERNAHQCSGEIVYSRMDICSFLDELEFGYYKPTPGKWISVDDELPVANLENNHVGDVLVYIPPREGVYQSGIRIGKLRPIPADETGEHNVWGVPRPGSKWTVWGWGYSEEPIVTHWMPLPKLPR